jgi:hypothetical protein
MELKMSFNPLSSKIAITMPKFKLKKNADGPFSKYSEPYIISMAIDESGRNNPAIDFNVMPFPKVAKGGTVNMLGDGHLLYGPRNPGEYVALSILVMESDGDMRNLGGKLKEIVSHKAIELGVSAIVTANPGSAAVLAILKELTNLVSEQLRQNKDDELFRVEGAFLRDGSVPYHINREYDDLNNDYIQMSLRVIPLDETNKQGSEVTSISL